jgi:tetratricopeptide (TPR) repeat protein
MKVVSAALVLLVATTAGGQTVEGDRLWNLRADGSHGGRAAAGPIEGAIAAYARAVAQNPYDLEARARLLRAYRFKGAYVASTNDQKKAVYTEAKKAGDDAIAIVEKLLAARGLKNPSKASAKQVAEAVRPIAHAAEIYLWDAVNWGEWALAYGKIAAARQGAADRILRGATIAELVDPRMEGGTPSRVLGRLHDQTPRIPFLTGWASQREAVLYLSESHRIDPHNKITMVFLAEALLGSSSPEGKRQAVDLTRMAATAPNEPPFLVEQSAAQADAQALLKEWGLK